DNLTRAEAWTDDHHVQQLCLYMLDPAFSVHELSQLIAYSVVNGQGCPDLRRRLLVNNVFFLGDYLLTWSSNVRSRLSRYSVVADYRGVRMLVAETSLDSHLLVELHTHFSQRPLVYCDNVSAVYLSANPVATSEHPNI
ncbi:ribonuclease H-like domain-containing protein, partial [Tanacetum coccineum]